MKESLKYLKDQISCYKEFIDPTESDTTASDTEAELNPKTTALNEDLIKQVRSFAVLLTGQNSLLKQSCIGMQEEINKSIT